MKNADDQYNLDFCYEIGNEVPKDLAKAVEWYREAAKQGYAEAQFNLGLCYANGKGVPKDLTQAAEWYLKAAEQGLAEAQYNLGLCYYHGSGVTQNHYDAVKWYREAAKQGHTDAQAEFKKLRKAAIKATIKDATRDLISYIPIIGFIFYFVIKNKDPDEASSYLNQVISIRVTGLCIILLILIKTFIINEIDWF